MGNLDITNAATEYLERGLRVIALTGKAPNGKVHPHGLHDAFTEYSHDIEKAFLRPDTTGVGILTGMPYYVVDIDGEDGAQQWRDLVGYGEYVPDRWAAQTGRGLHLWVASFETWPTVKLGPKLDFKGNGGYVAAPPSMHPEGHLYQWLLEPGDLPPMEAPEPLLAVLREQKALKEASILGKGMRRPVPMEDRIPGLLYKDVSYAGLIESVQKAGEGNRNNLLFWAAATMTEEGASPDDMNALLAAAVESGLDRAEARRTITSAVRSLSE